MRKPAAFLDMHKLPEDERIKLIGEAAMTTPGPVAVITDDEPGKLDRYIEKLQKLFPTLRVVWRGAGPTPGVVTAKVQNIPE